MDNSVPMSVLMSRHMDDEATRTSTSEGLEEGEVEGETLLLVESEDQASVDLSHDQSGDSLNSDLGDDGDSSWMEEMSYYCEKCQKWILASQLRGQQPSYLKGDNFFKFTCSACSEDAKEHFERLKLTWQQVVMLAMYNLCLEGTGRQGYFRWKEDICSYIEKHWTFLLGSRKKTSTWWSTVAGCLSVGSPVFFRSGAQEFGEPGWWKLVHNRPPTMKPECERLSDLALKTKDDEELDGDGVIDPGIEYIPPPSTSIAGGALAVIRKKVNAPDHIKQEIESEEEKAERMDVDGDGAAGLNAKGREKRKSQPETDDLPQAPKYMGVSLYEENLILKRLESCPNALAISPEARRLRRRLKIRQAKRERGLPLFDLDQAVNAALTLVGGVYGTKGGGICRFPMGRTSYRKTSQDFRILDRFQTILPAMKGYNRLNSKFLHRLVGSEDMALEHSIISPYTSRVLKPYIRRDHETKPPKLRLLAEVRAYPHQNDASWKPETESPIDYCYVRPNHIPTINSMCHEFFWPGIDLSECLQYPDFSVVVLYKKVIVAFGFMVPDVKYNEAYISFLFVHPEWRRAGIATFMIYHLIQTCMGKDVTLHVSASNSAMLLYQKFGFKTEEYVLDFYDKYYPLDSKECKHAFFLRLRR